MEREIRVASGSAWTVALATWDRRLDTEEARCAARSFEELAHDAVDDADAWTWCARARFYLGDYEVDDARRREHFEHGTAFGRRALDLDGTHAGALFWTSACEASWVDMVGVLRGAMYVPGIIGRMKRLWEREPTYYHRGAARLLGQALVRQPRLVQRFLPLVMPEVSFDDAIRELRQTIAEGPPVVMAYQTLGQVMYALRGDRATAREMLQAVEGLDLGTHPALLPENTRDRPRAVRLLSEIA